jgi:hypothetical protein
MRRGVDRNSPSLPSPASGSPPDQEPPPVGELKQEFIKELFLISYEALLMIRRVQMVPADEAHRETFAVMIERAGELVGQIEKLAGDMGKVVK